MAHPRAARVTRRGAYLVVSPREHETHGRAPGVIVETPVGVRRHEAMQIQVPALDAGEIVAFQVGLAVLAVDETARQTGGQTVK